MTKISKNTAEPSIHNSWGAGHEYGTRNIMTERTLVNVMGQIMDLSAIYGDPKDFTVVVLKSIKDEKAEAPHYVPADIMGALAGALAAIWTRHVPYHGQEDMHLIQLLGKYVHAMREIGAAGGDMAPHAQHPGKERLN